MDQELIAYLDERFRETNQQIGGLREEFGGLREEFGGLREEFGGLREEFGGLREEFGGLQEEFVSLREETAQRFDRLEEKVRHNGVEIEALRGQIRQVSEVVAGANQSLGAFRQEVAVEFKDVRSSIRVPFENLNKRVLVLEAKVKVLGKNPQKGKSRPPS